MRPSFATRMVKGRLRDEPPTEPMSQVSLALGGSDFHRSGGPRPRATPYPVSAEFA